MASDSDDFNRSNGAVGAEWTAMAAGGSGNSHQIDTNRCTGIDGEYNLMRFNAFSPTANQTTGIQFISASATSWVVNVGVRLTGTSGNCNGYMAQFAFDNTWRIVRLDNDTETEIKAPAAITLAGNDILELQISGTSLTAFRNAGSIGGVTDATHSAAGQGGIGIFMDTGNLLLDNFTITDLAGSSIAAISHYYSSMLRSGQ